MEQLSWVRGSAGSGVFGKLRRVKSISTMSAVPPSLTSNRGEYFRVVGIIRSDC